MSDVVLAALIGAVASIMDYNVYAPNVTGWKQI